jgi:hypothetical protein
MLANAALWQRFKRRGMDVCLWHIASFRGDAATSNLGDEQIDQLWHYIRNNTYEK